MCLALCFIFKLNVPAASIFNLIMTPVDFLLFIPFIALGDRILQSKALPGETLSHLPISLRSPSPAESPSLLIDGLKKNFFETLLGSAAALAHGIVAWIIVSIPLTFVLYRFILWGLRKRAARTTAQHLD